MDLNQVVFDSIQNWFKTDKKDKIILEDDKKILVLDGNVNELFYERFIHLYSQCKSNDDIIIELTTKGGELNWGYMISQILLKHNGFVTIRVPKFVLSTGTVIALAADKIELSTIGCLGSIDSHFYGLNIPTSTKVIDEYNNEKVSWLKWITTCWITVILNYSGKILNRINNDHQKLIKNILKKYEDRANLIYDFFTNTNYHCAPIYYEDIPKELKLCISVNKQMLNTIFHRTEKNPKNIFTEMTSAFQSTFENKDENYKVINEQNINTIDEESDLETELDPNLKNEIEQIFNKNNSSFNDTL